MNQDFQNEMTESLLPYEQVNVKKEMERNGTMLFVYQLLMFAFTSFFIFYFSMLYLSIFAQFSPLDSVMDNITTDPGGSYVLMMIAVLIAYIPVLRYMKRQNLPLRTQLKKTEAPKKIIWIGLLLCLAASSLGTVILYPVEYLANSFGYTVTFEMETSTSLFYYIASFLYVVLVGPVIEELVYRGGILMSLRRFGDKFAITVSAIIFGLMHGNLVQAIFATMVGFVLGYICVKTNSLRYCIYIHILNNFIATVIADYIYPNLSEQGVVMVDWATTIIFLLVGAMILYKLRGKIQLNSVAEIPVRHPYKIYFTRVPVVLCMLFFMMEIFFLSISALE